MSAIGTKRTFEPPLNVRFWGVKRTLRGNVAMCANDLSHINERRALLCDFLLVAKLR